MKIFVKAKPLAYSEKVEVVDKDHLTVSVKEPPIQGKANAAITLAIAKHFGVSPASVRLISGFASRQKVFDVNILL